jgi:hypothetical protein
MWLSSASAGLLSGAEKLELLCRHIPDRYEHLVRYVGRYLKRPLSVQSEEPWSAFAARTKAAQGAASSQLHN